MDLTGAVGYGYTVFRGTSTTAITQEKGRLGPAEVIDAEITGALQGSNATSSVRSIDSLC